MKNYIIFIPSIVISIVCPFVIIIVLYSFLNFINYIYTNTAIDFIDRNKIYIIVTLSFLILSIKIFRYNISSEILNEKQYIILALIGQLTICFILLLYILSIIFMPITVLAFFHILVSQLYIFIIFQDVPVIPIIINIFLIIITTLIAILISSIMPIAYTKKALKLINKYNINTIEKVEYINQIRVLIKIIKIWINIKKSKLIKNINIYDDPSCN